jgi:hypothetical protein
MNDLSPVTRAAFETALAIVQDTPAAPSPPVEIRYVDPHADIGDARYLMILFRSVGFLVDKDENKTLTIPLGVGTSSEEVLAKAKELALRHRLQSVYFPKQVSDR